MNRLTEIIMDNVYYSKGKYPPATLCAEMETWEVRECMAKLAVYEDTGLEPEEISKLIKEYNKDSTIAAHYEQLEEQGLLIKLPCKVGDSVYFVTQELDVVKGSCKKVIDEFIITEIRGNKYNPLWFMASNERCIHRDFHPTQISKSVFLTREEAEKALKEREEK